MFGSYYRYNGATGQYEDSVAPQGGGVVTYPNTGSSGAGSGAGTQTSPWTARTITPGQTGNEWAGVYNNLASSARGYTPAQVNAATVGPAATVNPASLSFLWQGGTGGGGGGGGNGGGGGTGGGGSTGSGVSTVDYSGLTADPTLMADRTAMTMAPTSDRLNNFTNSIYENVAGYLANPAGYSEKEYADLTSQAMDDVYASGAAEDEALAQQLSQQGFSPEQIADTLNRNRMGRNNAAANTRRALAIEAQKAKQEGELNKLSVGMSWSQQQQQAEQSAQQLQAQIDSNNQQMQLAVDSGNMQAANSFALQNQELLARQQEFNATAQNARQNLLSELQNQSSIARMNSRTQMTIAQNDAALRAALANAGYQQEANMYNAGQSNENMRFNAGNQQQAGIANAGFQNEASQNLNDYVNNVLLQGANAGIQQGQYNDNLMLQLLGMQSGQWNGLVNGATTYSQNRYQSNPNSYSDPYGFLYGGYSGYPG